MLFPWPKCCPNTVQNISWMSLYTFIIPFCHLGRLRIFWDYMEHCLDTFIFFKEPLWQPSMLDTKEGRSVCTFLQRLLWLQKEQCWRKCPSILLNKKSCFSASPAMLGNQLCRQSLVSDCLLYFNEFGLNISDLFLKTGEIHFRCTSEIASMQTKKSKPGGMIISFLVVKSLKALEL